MPMSQLKKSLGRAAENYDPTQTKKDGFKLRITPIEDLPFMDGELASNPTTDTLTSVNAAGETQETKVILDNAVTATWMPFGGSNRTTPPDVRRGERLILWRYADRPVYHWCTTGLDDHLRKLETVVYAYSATQDENQTELNDQNTYFLEISTHTGRVTYSSSQANGEFTRHQMQFDPMSGKFVLADAHGQSVSIDSTRAFIELVNHDGTRYTLTGPVAEIYAPDSINMTGDKAINLTTKALGVNAETVVINATRSFALTTQDAKLSAQSLELDVQTVSGSSVGTATLAGITISNGHIQCNGIDSIGPVHAPNIK